MSKNLKNDMKSIILSVYTEFDKIDDDRLTEDECNEINKSIEAKIATSECKELLKNIKDVNFILGERSDNMWSFPVKFIGPITELVELVKVWSETAGDVEEILDESHDYEISESKIINIINNNGIIDIFNEHNDDNYFYKDVIEPLTTKH